MFPPHAGTRWRTQIGKRLYRPRPLLENASKNRAAILQEQAPGPRMRYPAHRVRMGGRHQRPQAKEASPSARSVYDSIHVPAVRDSLQFVLARVLEREIRSDDEIPDGIRDENLARSSQSADSSMSRAPGSRICCPSAGALPRHPDHLRRFPQVRRGMDLPVPGRNARKRVPHVVNLISEI